MNGRDELAAPSDLSASPQLMGVERGVGGRALNGGATGGAAAAAPAPVAPPAPPASPDGAEPPRKRARPSRPDDAPALRRAILDCHLQRLKALRERFTEQLSELYFLQAGGNMMDYATWRRRPATPQLVAFLEARRPPPATEQVPTVSMPVATATPAPLIIPAVANLTPASTPVVSPAPVSATVQIAAPTPTPAPALAPVPILTPINTPLPAAAAPVTNTTPIPTPTITPTPTPAGAPAAPPVPAPASTAAPADEMVEKAKQEAYVARRVTELARAGLWTERRLPRVLEPPRSKSHWDYLLEEMAWLAQDFAHERKWKKQAARKCARAVQKYFQDKALAAQRAEKAQEMQLKKIAAFAAKEIRTFWSNVEKLVEWKRVRRVERARKEALDEQLSYIVDRTERYSRQLAANMAPAGPASTASTSGPATAAPSDDEFTPRGCSDDDEETIAAAEREAGLDAAAHKDEIEALRRESRLDLGDLLPPGYLPVHSPPPSDYSPDDDDDSADDERTIAEQERAERGRDAAAELDALRRDADLDIDELVRRYAAGEPADTDTDAETA
ncbi:helicase domino-like, partial [Manduca sexta]